MGVTHNNQATNQKDGTGMEFLFEIIPRIPTMKPFGAGGRQHATPQPPALLTACGTNIQTQDQEKKQDTKHKQRESCRE